MWRKCLEFLSKLDMLDMRIGLDMDDTTYSISSMKASQEPDIIDIRSILDI